MLNTPRHKRAGDSISHQEFNQLVDAAKQITEGPNGVSLNTGTSLASVAESPVHVSCIAREELLPYSVFSITLALADINLPHAEVKRIGVETGASPFTLATNGQFKIAVDDKFTATIIGPMDSTVVRVDPADIPAPGYSCGVKTGELQVCGTHGFGFICLGAVFTRNAVQLIRVVRATDNMRLIGVVSTEITAGSGTTLGTGTVEIHYRNAANVLLPATPPGGVPADDWLMEVWNPGASTFAVGVVVQLAGVTGTGFCVMSAGGESPPPKEPNPGVVTVEIETASPCLGESFEELGYHAFRAKITSRPFGSPASDLMRKEIAGNLTIFDPTGCMLDSTYEPVDFLPSYGNAVTAFVSLMYGGVIFEEEYNFKGGSGRGPNDVLPGDQFETFDPPTSCKPFGFDGGVRIGYTASIGIAIDSVATFKVKLPEKGIYKITITYGDATDPTHNLITMLDDVYLLATLENRSDPIDTAQTWTHTGEYDFKSSNAPILRITLNNAPDENDVGRESRIIKLMIKQISSPTRWEVINRCCVPRDLE